MRCYNCSPSIISCTLSGNWSDCGGGISCYLSQAAISFCEISGNSAQDAAGGIYCTGSSSPSIENCSITSNTVFTGVGGGIVCSGESAPVIGDAEGRGNSFAENKAAKAGMDIYADIVPNRVIPARHNHFAGFHLSDYYVSPPKAFDLTNCSSELSPVVQDVFIAPDGDDENAGLSPDEPFLTVHRALRCIGGNENNPLIVHLACGVYSPSLTGEVFPLPLLPFVSLEGKNAASTVLDAEHTSSVLSVYHDDNLFIRGLTISGGCGMYGGGIECCRSRPQIFDCTITQNSARIKGGGIYSNFSSPVIMNCTLSDNSSWRDGGALYFINSDSPHIINCTAVHNSSDAQIDGIFALYSSILAQNCILWNNHPRQTGGSENLTIEYSDVQGGCPGTGNINSNPLFCSGPCGDFYLSQTAAGQSLNSPCADSGSEQAGDICFDAFYPDLCLDESTTRTDHKGDSNIVDMGRHYFPNTATPTPGLSVTPTNTPAITQTIPPLGVKLELSQNLFAPGDDFLLTAEASNPGPIPLLSQPLVVLLDCFSYYYWHPNWTEQFDYQPVNLYIGVLQLKILDFVWPSVTDESSGIFIYAAMLNQSFTDIIGEWDSVSFAWTY